jgi:hypothetical protein
MHQYYHGHSVVYGIDPQKTNFQKRVMGIVPSSLHPAQKLTTPGLIVGDRGLTAHVDLSKKHHPNDPHGKGHDKHKKHKKKDGSDCDCDCDCCCCCDQCCPPPPYYGFAPSAEMAAKMPWWKRDGGAHEYPHSGYAWAATRHAIESLGGLFELAAMGAGDYHMALSLIGYADNSIPTKTHQSYRKHLKEWETRALRHINLNLGYVQGTIEHYWHGRKADRRYIDRWQICLEHDFDPDEDIMRNTNGVLELTCRKPKLRHDLDMYLKQRNEDSNQL